MTSVFTQTDCSGGNFVTISNGRTGATKECFELQLDKNKNLSLETLHVQFPEALAIKYKNPESGIMRILKAEKSVIVQPPEGWSKTEFIVVNNQESAKRPASDSVNGPVAKILKPLLSTPRGPPSLMQGSAGMPFMGGPGPTMNGFNGPADFQNDDFGQSLEFGGGMGLAPMPMMGSSPHGPFPLHCDLCKVSMNSQNQAQLHFEGRRHNEAVAQHRGGGMPTFGPTGPMMVSGPPSVFPPPAPTHMMGGGPGGMTTMNGPPFFSGSDLINGKQMRGGMGGRGNSGMRRGGNMSGGGRGRSFVAVKGRGGALQKPGMRGGNRGGSKRGGGRGARGGGPNGQSFTADDLGGFQRF